MNPARSALAFLALLALPSPATAAPCEALDAERLLDALLLQGVDPSGPGGLYGPLDEGALREAAAWVGCEVLGGLSPPAAAALEEAAEAAPWEALRGRRPDETPPWWTRLLPVLEFRLRLDWRSSGDDLGGRREGVATVWMFRLWWGLGR